MTMFEYTLEDKIMKKLMLALVVVFALPLYSGSIAQAEQRSIVVVLTGTATGAMRMIGGIEMDCFDVDIMDPVSGRILGTGTDCLDLSTITPIGDDGGFTLNNTQFFHLPEGTIVTAVVTTIQPVGAGSPGVTHVTGAVSADGENQIVDGDRRYNNAQGRVRLNGGVDMAQFGANIITFDCIFRIDFD
jgi:hypothetical protein